MAGGGAQVMPCQVNPRPICTGAISPSKAHLNKPRECRDTKAGGNPRFSRRKDTLSRPLPGLFQERNILTQGGEETWPSWSKVVGE